MAEVHLHIERRTLEPGRPVAVWRGRSALYAAYDPAQIREDVAVQAIQLLVPGAPDLVSVTRAGETRRTISGEDIAKHGRRE